MAVHNYASSRVCIILQQHIKYQIRHSSVRSLRFKSFTLSAALYFTRVLSAPSCLNWGFQKFLNLKWKNRWHVLLVLISYKLFPFITVMTNVWRTAEFVNVSRWRMGHFISLHGAGMVQQWECKVGQRCQAFRTRCCFSERFACDFYRLAAKKGAVIPPLEVLFLCSVSFLELQRVL